MSLLTSDARSLEEFSGFDVALALAAYPFVSASGVYLMGRVLGEEGSFFGALAAGAVAGAAGIVGYTGTPFAFVVYLGSPIAALIGFHGGFAPVSGPNGDIVPSASFRIQF